MSDTDSVTSDCGRRIINGVDFLARRYDIRKKPVPLDTMIGNLGLGDNDCAIFERYINRERAHAKRAKLKSGTITPSATIAELISHAC